MSSACSCDSGPSLNEEKSFVFLFLESFLLFLRLVEIKQLLSDNLLHVVWVGSGDLVGLVQMDKSRRMCTDQNLNWECTYEFSMLKIFRSLSLIYMNVYLSWLKGM